MVVSGEGSARDRHPEVASPDDFDRTEWPNQMVHQAWYRNVPVHLTQSMHPHLDSRSDRVVWLLVQTFVG